MNRENKPTTGHSTQDIIIAILVFGSIWGFLEATLGGFLNLIIFPNKGAIMAGIGVAIMGMALAIYRRPSMAPAIGMVAASFKLLNVWIFVPVSYVHIVNPATAIFLESLAFSLVAALLMNRIARNPMVGVGAGALAGIITAAAFVYFALYVTNSPLLQRLGVSGPVQFIAGSGLVQAAFFGIFLPIGYQLGERLAGIRLVSMSRPRYYAASAAVICLCWAVSAIVVAAGL
ncbi:hypothetical protein ACFLXH_00330 [Chloroflexota bacterium]